MRNTRMTSFLPVRVRTQTGIIVGIIVLSLFVPLKVEGVASGSVEPLARREVAAKITDREIVESLVAIRGDIKRIDQRFDSVDKRFDSVGQRFESVDKRFEAVDKRFDAVDKRFDSVDQRFNSVDKRFDSVDQRFNSVDKRFDSVDKRFDELRDFMVWGFGVLIAGMFSLVGFVLWDRRTALSPAIRKNRELEEREEKIERALREYAMKEPKLAEILKQLGLL